MSATGVDAEVIMPIYKILIENLGPTPLPHVPRDD
jgi:hypothetical protein